MSFNTEVVLFDMNNLEFEEINIDWEKELKDEFDLFSEEKNQHFINRSGLVVSPKFELKIYDYNLFIKSVISILFKDYEIIDCQQKGKSETGHPDFILKKDSDTIYLELKLGEDSLRLSQMRWFSENKDKKNKVLWIYPHLQIFSDTLYGNYKDGIISL